MPIRIVMDTNVLIAALRSETGASADILRELPRNKIEIQLSNPLYIQYVDVVARHVGELRYSAQQAQDILAYLAQIANHHNVYFLVRPGSVDPRDEMILELAVAARADFIVTHNIRHFSEAEKYGVQVLKPIQLLRAIGVR